MSESENRRFDQAIDLIDKRNATDPTRVSYEGQSWPRGELYGRRMSEWLERLSEEASEELRLSVRAQHLARHEMPRSDYPEGRRGYLGWRSNCKRRHAQLAAEILEQVGYEAATVERVKDLIEKRRLSKDEEAQTLEDTACLVFLEDHLMEFAAKHDEDKLVSILSKTWHKMSERGHQAALELELDGRLASLLERALDLEPSG